MAIDRQYLKGRIRHTASDKPNPGIPAYIRAERREELMPGAPTFDGNRTEVMRLRIDPELKAAFVERCKEENITPSDALHRFMDDYVCLQIDYELGGRKRYLPEELGGRKPR